MLAVSAVESVAGDENWSAEQRDLIDKLAAEIADPEVKEAVERMHRISIRQGIRRVLRCNRLDHLWEEWDDLYKRRSRLFHGGGEFTNQEIGTCFHRHKALRRDYFWDHQATGHQVASLNFTGI